MGEKKIIKIDPDLKDLVPTYLEHMAQHLEAMPKLLEAGKFEELWSIGHKIHGSGGGYGLDFLTEFGERLEAAVKRKDRPAIEAQIKELKEFLDCLEIEYADPD